MPNFNWDELIFNYLQTFHKTCFFPTKNTSQIGDTPEI